MPRVLITNIHLREFGGSEMVTLELAEEFVARGWDVDVFASVLGEPFSREFEPLLDKGTQVSDVPEHFRNRQYDLLWVHHSLLPAPLLESLIQTQTIPPMIWNHMSGHVPLEMPVLADVEERLAWRTTVVSPEAAMELTDFGLSDTDIRLLQNPVPRSFSKITVTDCSPALKRVLFVSNHPPAEVEEAKKLLASRGIESVGIGGTSPTRVGPAQFEGVDAVVTMAKSVQYSLCLGIPVYEYDHHGGCGWISSENFETELQTNFSGRTTRRKVSASVLTNELVTGYSAARKFAQENLAAHRQRFGIEQRLDELLSSFSNAPHRRLSKADGKRLHSYSEILCTLYNTRLGSGSHEEVETQFKDLLSQFDQLSKEYRVLKDKLAASQAEVTAIRNSRTVRLAKSLASPFAQLRRSSRN